MNTDTAANLRRQKAKNYNISIGDTAYGREVALKKRELDAAAHKLSREEIEALQQNLDAMVAAKMDADEANVTAETMPAAMEGLEPF